MSPCGGENTHRHARTAEERGSRARGRVTRTCVYHPGDGRRLTGILSSEKGSLAPGPTPRLPSSASHFLLLLAPRFLSFFLLLGPFFHRTLSSESRLLRLPLTSHPFYRPHVFLSVSASLPSDQTARHPVGESCLMDSGERGGGRGGGGSEGATPVQPLRVENRLLPMLDTEEGTVAFWVLR